MLIFTVWFVFELKRVDPFAYCSKNYRFSKLKFQKYDHFQTEFLREALKLVLELG